MSAHNQNDILPLLDQVCIQVLSASESNPKTFPTQMRNSSRIPL